MEATHKTMELASTISKFEIVELWREDSLNNFECKYVYIAAEYQNLFPQLICGHYPQHTKEHKISPGLCMAAKLSPEKYFWNAEDIVKIINGCDSYNIKSKFAIFLDSEDANINIYLVCFSFTVRPYNTSLLQYLTGLCLTIYISAYYLDEERVRNDLDGNEEVLHKDIHLQLLS
mmetsp:Transcript_10092/g.13863  ORF Transcript_10092/g.13863 Transcript_10092/m.13863 type:complete len:175 (-) Transcript_10092:624-1148(-)